MNLRRWFKGRKKQSAISTSTHFPVEKEPVGYVGHGRHFYFLEERGDIDAVLNELLQKLLTENLTGNLTGGKGKALQHGDLWHVCDGRGDLMLSVLMRPDEMLAVYPFDDTGYGWPFTVQEIYPWPNGVEAQLVGNCRGARIGFFDTLFFRNRSYYRQDVALTFLINGLAYKLFESKVPEGFSEDFTAYLPLTPEQEGGVDEVQFESRVEAVAEVDFWGIPLLAYTLTLAAPDGFPLRLTMYSHESAGPRRFAPGDRIRGIAWLFGSAVPDQS